MRMSRIFDEGGGYVNSPVDPGNDPIDPLDPGVQTPGQNIPGGGSTGNPATPGGPPAGTPAGGPEPTSASEPGPTDPQPPGAGNPPAPKPPTPPAVPSAIKGVQANEATGGVGGSFGQAGSMGFAKRFGTPASWFRGGADPGTGPLIRERPNRGRGAMGRGGGMTGGGTFMNPSRPSDPSGLVSGGSNDEQWQRMVAEVLKQRFGG